MELNEIQVVKAKLVGGLFCHYTYQEAIGNNRYDEHKVKSQRPCHEDLIKAFARLVVHMPVIFSVLQPDDISGVGDIEDKPVSESEKTIEVLGRFTVNEVERSVEEACAALTGTWVLDLGTADITSPMISYEGSYHYKEELRFMVDQLMEEVRLYHEGKQAPEQEQPELFADHEPDEEQPKKKRGRPKRVTPDPDEEFNKPEGSFKKDPADVID